MHNRVRRHLELAYAEMDKQRKPKRKDNAHTRRLHKLHAGLEVLTDAGAANIANRLYKNYVANDGEDGFARYPEFVTELDGLLKKFCGTKEKEEPVIEDESDERLANEKDDELPAEMANKKKPNKEMPPEEANIRAHTNHITRHLKAAYRG